jgi:hypothetical protein
MLLKAGIATTLAATAPDSAGGATAVRSLWMQGDARFLRSWLLLGPRPGKLADGLGVPATAIASAGLRQELADGQPLTWQPRSSWTDAAIFSRNSQGRTTGLTINDRGSQVFATRIE